MTALALSLPNASTFCPIADKHEQISSELIIVFSMFYVSIALFLLYLNLNCITSFSFYIAL